MKIHRMFEVSYDTNTRLGLYEIVFEDWLTIEEEMKIYKLNRPTYYVNEHGEKIWFVTDRQYHYLQRYLDSVLRKDSKWYKTIIEVLSFRRYGDEERDILKKIRDSIKIHKLA